MEMSLRFYPDPVLRRETEEIRVFDQDLKVLVDEMTVIMQNADGVGLAAPQVGLSKKIAVVMIEGRRYVLINPVIVEEEGQQTGEEGCLSFPGVFGEVKRPYRVVVECRDETGEAQRYEAEGFLARAMVHEIDHLNGKLLIDKFSPIKRELIKKRLAKANR